MANLEAMLGLLELVYSAGGGIDSRIRLQKEAYLLACSNLGRFKLHSFSYHHYGPYSRDLSDALQAVVSYGFLDESRLEPDDGSYVKYSYALSDAGEQFVKEADSDLGDVSNKVGEFGKMHWRALELAATIRFLELNEKVSSREDATKEALKLKPATQKYLADAKVVLSNLG